MARKKDAWTKKYMENPEIFADVFNYLLYDGQLILDSKKLYPVDSAVIGIPYGETGAGVPIQRYRDILKHMEVKADGDTIYLLLGIENQSKVHYAMPVRNMVYDALQYAAQVECASKSHKKSSDGKRPSSSEYLSGFYKNDSLLPVVTLVVYFGADAWDGPQCVHDMFLVKDKNILRFVPDYKMNLIAPANLTKEDVNKFNTDMREVMLYVKYWKDKKKLYKLITSDKRYKMMDRITAETINAVTGSKLKFDREGKMVDMCKAIEDMRIEERQEGAIEKTKKIVQNLYKMGMSETSIAKAVDVHLALVKQWLGLVDIEHS